MEYIFYKFIPEARPFSTMHEQVIDRYVSNYEQTSRIDKSKTISGTTILDLELSDLDYEDLDKIHFHYSSKNNGASIESEGLRSGIGDNSEDIDYDEAIYFSLGVEGVLHNWDVWLKWRLNRFNNPRAAGVKCDKELNYIYSAELWKYSVDWAKYLSSRDYRKNERLLKPVFEYERIELSRSDYLALVIVPGVDYPVNQEDPKKCVIEGFEYAMEIYGVGVSTDISNDYAEKWNLSTKLGEPSRIPPDRIFRTAVNGKDDALSVLCYLYHRYLDHCRQNNTAPADFALLPQFVKYCQE